MSLRTFIAGIAVAAGIALVGTAEAAVQIVTVNGTNASATYDSSFNVGDGGIVFGSKVNSGAFTHEVYFTVDTNAVGGVTSTPNTLQLGSLVLFDVLGLTYQVFDAGTNAAVSGIGTASSLLTFASTAGADYFVRFLGTATGALGGNYTANLSFAVTPIPGAILLIAPALAGLGFAGYRRRRTA